MEKVLSKRFVCEERDKAYCPEQDLCDDVVYRRTKVEVKARTVFYERYAPSCTTFTYAQAQYQQRPMDALRGQGDDRPQVAEETKLAIRACALVRIKHAIGYVFSIEHV